MLDRHTLPVDAYEKEVVHTAREVDTALEEAHKAFKRQPWVIAILDRRRFDNTNRMSVQGRTYEVTQIHINQVRTFFNRTKLYGYQLIEISEEDYARRHFPNGPEGERKITNVDGDLHLSL